jgi:hypothetical protein
MATNQCVDINKGGLGSDPAQVLNGLCCKYASFYPYLSHITNTNIATYLSTIKTAIPYHVYWVLMKHPELIIDKLDMFLLLLYNIQKTAFANSKNVKVRNNLQLQNQDLLKILQHYFYYCSNINAAGALVPPDTADPAAIAAAAAAASAAAAAAADATSAASKGASINPPATKIKSIDQVGFMDPSLPVAIEYNKQLDKLVESIKSLVEKQNEDNPILTKLYNNIFGLEMKLNDMKTEESKLNLKLDKPDYIKMSSVWFIMDTQGDEKKPAPAAGQAELEKLIRAHQDEVIATTRLSTPVLKETMEIAIKAFSYIPKIMDPSVTITVSGNLDPQSGKPQIIETDNVRLLEGTTNKREEDIIIDTRKFLADQISTNAQVRQEFVDNLIKTLQIADVKVRARICNNISDLLFQPQFNLNDFQKGDLLKYGNCNILKQKSQQQSKKNNKKDRPKASKSLNTITKLLQPPKNRKI